MTQLGTFAEYMVVARIIIKVDDSIPSKRRPWCHVG